MILKEQNWELFNQYSMAVIMLAKVTYMHSQHTNYQYLDIQSKWSNMDSFCLFFRTTCKPNTQTPIKFLNKTQIPVMFLLFPVNRQKFKLLMYRSCLISLLHCHSELSQASTCIATALAVSMILFLLQQWWDNVMYQMFPYLEILYLHYPVN